MSKIRIAAASILLFIWGVQPWRVEDAQMIVAIFLTLPLAFLILRPRPSLALVQGSIGLLVMFYVLLFPYGRALGIVYIAVLICLHAAMARFAWLAGGRPSGGQLGYGAGFMLLAAVVFFIVDVGEHEVRYMQQVLARKLLRTVNQGQAAIIKKNPAGYAGDLGQVAPFTEDRPLKDEFMQVLTAKRENYSLILRYRFIFNAGPRDAAGRITHYEMVAQPDKPRYDSFFTDETGVIRFCPGSRAATAQDPSL